MILPTIDENIIKQLCVSARLGAQTRHEDSTKVGALIFTEDEKYYEGFNIQTDSHKDYHAEEVAMINFALQHGDKEKVLGIAVTYSNPDKTKLTFPCGHCLQALWEYFKNPNLLIMEVDIKTYEILDTKYLCQLYTVPYPYMERK